jgi:nitroimidazol reductase NimA-like FMN-containing flavoprotein (pyridoxamine 5'-phosphate oxidase superfamily)
MSVVPAFTPSSKIGPLTAAEIDAFLAHPWNARLATVTPRHEPHVVAVWYRFDPEGRVFYVVPRARSIFVEHIKHNPAVALHIADDAHLEHTRVIVQGRAEIMDGPVAPEHHSRLRGLVLDLARSYLGERGPEYAGRTLGRPRYLLKIVPNRWRSWTGREWAPSYYR